MRNSTWKSIFSILYSVSWLLALVYFLWILISIFTQEGFREKPITELTVREFFAIFILLGILFGFLSGRINFKSK